MSGSFLVLLPAIALFVYFLGGVPFFALRVRKHGLPHDARIDARRPSRLLPHFIIYYLHWMISPVERALLRSGVSPNGLTFVGLVLSAVIGVALAKGAFDLGGWLYLFVGIIDIFDGRIARATGKVTTSGAFYDSVVDRYSEFAVHMGLILYYRDSWILYVVLASLVGSFMVSYTRARAEALGGLGDGHGGLMQRPERLVYLGVALAGSPLVARAFESGVRPTFYLAALMLLFLGLATNLTALARFRDSFRILRAKDPQPTQGVAAAPALAPPPTPAAEPPPTRADAPVRAT